MVIQLDAVPRPLVRFALCRDTAQLPLWDSKLDCRKHGIPERLLAYGVAISEEGPYICSEIRPFEPHPLIRLLLTSWDLLKSNRRRRRALQWWPDRREAERIDRSVRVIRSRPGQPRLRKALGRIWDVDLPAVTMYSLDGERTWKGVEQNGGRWSGANIRKRLSRQKTVDPRDTCLKLSDRITEPEDTDRRQWLRQRLNGRASGCSIYTPARRAYSPR